MTGKIRLKTILTKFNVSIKRVIELLKSRKITISKNPNTKINKKIYKIIVKEFQLDKDIRDASEKNYLIKQQEKENIIKDKIEHQNKEKNKDIIIGKADKIPQIKTYGSINLEKIEQINKKQFSKKKNVKKLKQKINKNKNYFTRNTSIRQALKTKIFKKPEHIETKYQKLSGLIITGDTIDLSQYENKIFKKKTYHKHPKKTQHTSLQKPQHKNIKKIQSKNNNKNKIITNEEIEKKIKQTLERINKKKLKYKTLKLKKDKRLEKREKINIKNPHNNENKIIEIAEFATINEISSMMKITETKVLSKCNSLGMIATLNQRLDSETIIILAHEFGYKVRLVGKNLYENIKNNEKEDYNKLIKRPPVVAIMGHVDHGKTSLLDFIRKSNTTIKEHGGITQHIGAYNVVLEKNEKITFIDTPGHEAFTAMRARGAKITDITVIVIASDDKIMPQTKEAIAHAQAEKLPMIFAINKIDKQTSNPEKIRQELAGMKILVEEWGGKYQSQNISSKTGEGIKELLKKIILETEILELKANPNKKATGVVVESTLDKGKGYITNILIQDGTLKKGDYMVAGSNCGKIKAIFNEKGKNLQTAGPSTSVIILGLNGAPSSGDKFKIYLNEKKSKKIAFQRNQLQKEQTIRSQKYLTLDEIGRRISVGDFKEIKIIIKGDVFGSLEAISDSLQKLSTDSIYINIISTKIGNITESDVIMAHTLNSIIIGFNVKSTVGAKKIAHENKVNLLNYKIIYDVVDKIKQIIKNLSSPIKQKKIIGKAEIREIFKTKKINNICGCIILYGKLIRNSKIEITRNDKIIYRGKIKSLKRFKEDIKEVSKGYECGVVVNNLKDVMIKDIIECYEEKTDKENM